MPDTPEIHAILRVLVAAVLGAVVGFDRQRKDKDAGIRTHMLVAMGAALFVSSAALLTHDSGDASGEPALRIDPTRVIQGVVTGVGFIGAGQIFQGRGSVHGLTSAAGMWVTASIGVLAGLGYVALPVVATAVVFLVMAWLDPLTARIGGDAGAIEEEG